MNLYFVCMKDADWGTFVFAETRNKARAMCVNYFSNDEDYPSLCAYLRAKNVEGEAGIADTNDAEDKVYKRVLALGFKFDEEREGEA